MNYISQSVLYLSKNCIMTKMTQGEKHMQKHGTEAEGQNEMHVDVSETGHYRQNLSLWLSNKSCTIKENLFRLHKK